MSSQRRDLFKSIVFIKYIIPLRSSFYYSSALFFFFPNSFIVITLGFRTLAFDTQSTAALTSFNSLESGAPSLLHASLFAGGSLNGDPGPTRRDVSLERAAEKNLAPSLAHYGGRRKLSTGVKRRSVCRYPISVGHRSFPSSSQARWTVEAIWATL